MTHGLAWLPKSIGRQASADGKGHKIMDQCRIHGGSIPRWQSRLGEESCSYPKTANGSISPARRGRLGPTTTWVRSSTAQAGISHSDGQSSRMMRLESVSCDGAPQVLP